MTKTELININKRGYQYERDLASLLENNPTILTADDAYNLYQSIKDDCDNPDRTLCFCFEVLRINKSRAEKQ